MTLQEIVDRSRRIVFFGGAGVSTESGIPDFRSVELEQAGKCTAVVTQNIDGLHQAAGSRTVYELHGSVLRNHCMRCGRAYGVEAVAEAAGIPRCACGGIIKPDVVLYEEGLDQQTVEGAVHLLLCTRRRALSATFRGSTLCSLTGILPRRTNWQTWCCTKRWGRCGPKFKYANGGAYAHFSDAQAGFRQLQSAV